MKRKVIGSAAVALLTAWMASAAWAQDFQKNYTISSGGTISISNVSGEISVTGTNGSSILVNAYREGRDKDLVQIEDNSTADHISLKVDYPKTGGNVDASVRFVVQVPSRTPYQFDKLSTASGDIQVANVAGELGVNTASGSITIAQIVGNVHARTASGDVNISQVHGLVQTNTASGDVTIKGITGTVSASTASGDLDVELVRIEGTGDLVFSSASGDVTIKAPGQIDAQVDISTANGSIKSDFPLTMDDLQHSGQKAHGQLGSGALKLKISTASGDVKFIRS